MKTRPETPHHGASSAGAFSLVEVTIALAVAGFCLLAILGLLQTGLSSERATVEQTAATGILSSVYADLAATTNTSSNSKIYGLNLSSTAIQTLWFSDGGATNASASAARYRATVAITPSSGQSPAIARLLVTWPAAADSQPLQWPSKQSGAVEVVTSLDRN